MIGALPKGLVFLTSELFDPCVGEQFEVDSKPVAVQLRLDRVLKHRQGPGFLAREPFTLLWSTDPSINMVLGIYALRLKLRQGSWGPHQVYIEPTGPTNERHAYQSVFF
jgi:hypothetical protein